jgi:hypothetical protein
MRYLIVDPETAQAGREAVHAFGDAMPLTAEKVAEFMGKKSEERKAWVARAVEEYRSGEYHISVRMYEV